MAVLSKRKPPLELIKVEFSNDQRMTMTLLVLIAILDIMSQTTQTGRKTSKTTFQTRYKTCSAFKSVSSSIVKDIHENS